MNKKLKMPSDNAIVGSGGWRQSHFSPSLMSRDSFEAGTPSSRVGRKCPAISATISAPPMNDAPSMKKGAAAAAANRKLPIGGPANSVVTICAP